MRQDGARPIEEVLRRTRQVADTIDVAANAGVYHGMMTPGDVILDGERTGVTGFGLAQALIKAGIPAEAGPPYGSPQRVAGAPPTRADDIYSLAAIALELLIGTPKEEDADARALREAQGLPERRRVQRPEAHETRLFTTIPGADAGKLRACFATAFSEKPGERPSTASEFVATFHNAFSNRGETDTPAPRVVAAPLVSNEPQDPPPAPVLNIERDEDTARAGEQAPLEIFRQEHVVVERQEMPAASQPPIREPHTHRHKRKRKQRRRTPEGLVAPPAPAVGDALVAEVTPPPASSSPLLVTGLVADVTPPRASSSPLFIIGLVAASLAAGFGGGFVVGRQSSSIEPTQISRDQPVAKPRPARRGADPKAIVGTTQTAAPVSNEQASSSESGTATGATQPEAPAVDSGRLVVRSTPAGASVMVDGESRGLTPLELHELALGAHTVRVTYPGHDTRERQVTFSEGRPVQSLDFELRPASAASPAAPAADSPGSLIVTSQPAGAQVFVDDGLIGTTPLLLSDVAVGARQMRIELTGYKPWTTSVLIKPGARSRVAANLEP